MMWNVPLLLGLFLTVAMAAGGEEIGETAVTTTPSKANLRGAKMTEATLKLQERKQLEDVTFWRQVFADEVNQRGFAKTLAEMNAQDRLAWEADVVASLREPLPASDSEGPSNQNHQDSDHAASEGSPTDTDTDSKADKDGSDDAKSKEDKEVEEAMSFFNDAFDDATGLASFGTWLANLTTSERETWQSQISTLVVAEGGKPWSPSWSGLDQHSESLAAWWGPGSWGWQRPWGYQPWGWHDPWGWHHPYTWVAFPEGDHGDMEEKAVSEEPRQEFAESLAASGHRGWGRRGGWGRGGWGRGGWGGRHWGYGWRGHGHW